MNGNVRHFAKLDAQKALYREYESDIYCKYKGSHFLFFFLKTIFSCCNCVAFCCKVLIHATLPLVESVPQTVLAYLVLL